MYVVPDDLREVGADAEPISMRINAAQRVIAQDDTFDVAFREPFEEFLRSRARADAGDARLVAGVECFLYLLCPVAHFLLAEYEVEKEVLHGHREGIAVLRHRDGRSAEALE